MGDGEGTTKHRCGLTRTITRTPNGRQHQAPGEGLRDGRQLVSLVENTRQTPPRSPYPPLLKPQRRKKEKAKTKAPQPSRAVKWCASGLDRRA